MTKMSERRRFSPAKKAEIIREHYKNKVSISEICNKYGINPSIFYRWDKQLIESAIEIFSGNHTRKSNGCKNAIQKKLEEKILKQQEVISWLTEENLKLKKILGKLKQMLDRT